MSAKPIIAINFKTYNTSTNSNARGLAMVCSAFATQAKSTRVIICVSAIDLQLIAKEVSIPVFGQHVDAVQPGAHTGSITAPMLALNGATGTLINHSEKRISLADIKTAILLCKKHRLTSIVCAATPALAKKIASFGPDYIAYEPPALIGGDVSVTTKPSIITKTVKMVRSVDASVKVLVGAGVKTGVDVKTAIDLGAAGVLLASAVDTAPDPLKQLKELTRLI